MRLDRTNFTLLSRSFCACDPAVVAVNIRHIGRHRTIWETVESEVSW